MSVFDLLGFKPKWALSATLEKKNLLKMIESWRRVGGTYFYTYAPLGLLKRAWKVNSTCITDTFLATQQFVDFRIFLFY